MTTESLYEVFRDQGAPCVVQSSGHNLRDARGLVSIARFGAYYILALLDWDQKVKVCECLSSGAGPIILPSFRSNVFATGSKIAVSLQKLIGALLYGEVAAITLAVYGMKQPIEELTYLRRACPIYDTDCRWDIGFQIDGNHIPALTLGETDGTIFPMLLNKGKGDGSVRVMVEDGGIDVPVKIYPKVMHTAKALYKGTPIVPKTMVLMKRRVGYVQEYVEEVKERKDDLKLGGMRVEAEVRGSCTLDGAIVIAQRVFSRLEDIDLQVAATVTIDEYIRGLEMEMRNSRGRFHGRNETEPSKIQKHLLAKLLNAIGFNRGGSFSRHLRPPPPEDVSIKKHTALHYYITLLHYYIIITLLLLLLP